MDSVLFQIAFFALLIANTIALPAVGWSYVRAHRGARRQSGQPSQLPQLGAFQPSCEDCEAVRELQLNLKSLEAKMDQQASWAAHIRRKQDEQEKTLAEMKGQMTTVLDLLQRGF